MQERQKTQQRELAQAKEIEKAYNKLKETQSQLVHAEKMASLGELTAGIAHEIQNPLNFVNNFSEVNAELIEELDEEIEKELKALKEKNSSSRHNRESQRAGKKSTTSSSRHHRSGASQRSTVMEGSSQFRYR